MTDTTNQQLADALAMIDALLTATEHVETDYAGRQLRARAVQMLNQHTTATCDTCGDRFTPNAAGRPRLYCSDACRQANYRTRAR